MGKREVECYLGAVSGASWRSWAPGLSAVLLFAVLAEALHRTRGHYKTNRVIFVTLAIVAFAILTWRRAPGAGAALERPLAALTVLGTSLLSLDALLLYGEVAAAQDGLRMLILLAWLGGLIGLAGTFRRRPAAPEDDPEARRRAARSRARGLALGLLVVSALVAARPLVLVASPAPHIDVFTTTDRAVDYLLSGTNPYAGEYPDIYEGRYDYAPGLVYWPGTVLFAALGKLAFGDLRASWLVGDLLAALALGWLAARRGRGDASSMGGGLAAAAVWLAFPVGLFVLEQAWVDPLVLAVLLGAALALDRERFGLAGALFGLAAATKQPAALAGVLAFGIVAFARPKASLRLAGAGLAAFAVVVGPFALGDPEGLWRMTVTVPLGQAMRPDSLSLVALAAREWGVAIPGGVSAVVYVALLGALLWRGARAGRSDGRPAPADRFLPALALLYAVVFLFGKQAFCNYWALTAGLVLAARLAAPPRSGTEPLYG